MESHDLIIANITKIFRKLIRMAIQKMHIYTHVGTRDPEILVSH